MKSRRAAPFYDGTRYQMAESVGHLMHRITVMMKRQIERRMVEHGLTAAQWMPLWMLESGKADTAQEITCAMNTDAGATTRIIDRLEAKGLVERERSADDRRVVRLRITDAGREVVRHVPSVLADVNNTALQGFDGEDFAQLKALLQRVHATLVAEETAE